MRESAAIEVPGRANATRDVDAEHEEPRLAPGKATLASLDGRMGVGSRPTVGKQTLISRSASGPVTAADPEESFSRAATGPASPLPHRDLMERLFGEDFSSVRVHLGRGVELADLGARAATRGETIVFATDAPPVKLVAHELAHVVQNRGGAGNGRGVSQPGDSSETEAAQVESLVERGAPSTREPLRISARPSGAIHGSWLGWFYSQGKALAEYYLITYGAKLMASYFAGYTAAFMSSGEQGADPETVELNRIGLEVLIVMMVTYARQRIFNPAPIKAAVASASNALITEVGEYGTRLLQSKGLPIPRWVVDGIARAAVQTFLTQKEEAPVGEGTLALCGGLISAKPDGTKGWALFSGSELEWFSIAGNVKLAVLGEKEEPQPQAFAIEPAHGVTINLGGFQLSEVKGTFDPAVGLQIQKAKLKTPFGATREDAQLSISRTGWFSGEWLVPEEKVGDQTLKAVKVRLQPIFPCGVELDADLVQEDKTLLIRKLRPIATKDGVKLGPIDVGEGKILSGDATGLTLTDGGKQPQKGGAVAVEAPPKDSGAGADATGAFHDQLLGQAKSVNWSDYLGVAVKVMAWLTDGKNLVAPQPDQKEQKSEESQPWATRLFSRLKEALLAAKIELGSANDPWSLKARMTEVRFANVDTPEIELGAAFDVTVFGTPFSGNVHVVWRPAALHKVLAHGDLEGGSDQAKVALKGLELDPEGGIRLGSAGLAFPLPDALGAGSITASAESMRLGKQFGFNKLEGELSGGERAIVPDYLYLTSLKFGGQSGSVGTRVTATAKGELRGVFKKPVLLGGEVSWGGGDKPQLSLYVDQGDNKFELFDGKLVITGGRVEFQKEPFSLSIAGTAAVNLDAFSGEATGKLTYAGKKLDGSFEKLKCGAGDAEKGNGIKGEAGKLVLLENGFRLERAALMVGIDNAAKIPGMGSALHDYLPSWLPGDVRFSARSDFDLVYQNKEAKLQNVTFSVRKANLKLFGVGGGFDLSKPEATFGFKKAGKFDVGAQVLLPPVGAVGLDVGGLFSYLIAVDGGVGATKISPPADEEGPTQLAVMGNLGLTGSLSGRAYAGAFGGVPHLFSVSGGVQAGIQVDFKLAVEATGTLKLPHKKGDAMSGGLNLAFVITNPRDPSRGALVEGAAGGYVGFNIVGISRKLTFDFVRIPFAELFGFGSLAFGKKLGAVKEDQADSFIETNPTEKFPNYKLLLASDIEKLGWGAFYGILNKRAENAKKRLDRQFSHVAAVEERLAEEPELEQAEKEGAKKEDGNPRTQARGDAKKDAEEAEKAWRSALLKTETERKDLDSLLTGMDSKRSRIEGFKSKIALYEWQVHFAENPNYEVKEDDWESLAAVRSAETENEDKDKGHESAESQKSMEPQLLKKLAHSSVVIAKKARELWSALKAHKVDDIKRLVMEIRDGLRHDATGRLPAKEGSLAADRVNHEHEDTLPNADKRKLSTKELALKILHKKEEVTELEGQLAADRDKQLVQEDRIGALEDGAAEKEALSEKLRFKEKLYGGPKPGATQSNAVKELFNKAKELTKSSSKEYLRADKLKELLAEEQVRLYRAFVEANLTYQTIERHQVEQGLSEKKVEIERKQQVSQLEVADARVKELQEKVDGYPRPDAESPAVPEKSREALEGELRLAQGTQSMVKAWGSFLDKQQHHFAERPKIEDCTSVKDPLKGHDEKMIERLTAAKEQAQHNQQLLSSIEQKVTKQILEQKKQIEAINQRIDKVRDRLGEIQSQLLLEGGETGQPKSEAEPSDKRVTNLQLQIEALQVELGGAREILSKQITRAYGMDEATKK